MKVFVSMPFDPAFGGVYRAIESAADDNKLKAYRVDQQRISEYIPEVIENMIKECVIFIADVTGNNPNVLNEIGQAKALGKQIILLSQDHPESAPFNIRSMTIMQYSKDALGELAAELREAFSLPNQALRSMLVPHSLGRPDRHKFVIAVSPLSYRRAMGKSKDYKSFRDTASDYVGLRGILQAFGLLYGFQTLPEIADPEDCAECVIEEKMTLYCIASPKTNRWTGRLLKKFCETWGPCIDFKADPASEDLKNVKVSLFMDGLLLHPDKWKVNSEHDRYLRDFGVIIRGQSPYHADEMMTVIAGRSSLGTEAASRALTSPEKIDEISRRLTELGASLEDHAKPFWALVSMERESGGSEEPIPGSLLLRHVGVFKRRS